MGHAREMQYNSYAYIKDSSYSNKDEHESSDEEAGEKVMQIF